MNWQEQWPEQLRKFGLLNPQRVAECKSCAEPTKIERELLAAMDPEVLLPLPPQFNSDRPFLGLLQKADVRRYAFAPSDLLCTIKTGVLSRPEGATHQVCRGPPSDRLSALSRWPCKQGPLPN